MVCFEVLTNFLFLLNTGVLEVVQFLDCILNSDWIMDISVVLLEIRFMLEVLHTFMDERSCVSGSTFCCSIEMCATAVLISKSAVAVAVGTSFLLASSLSLW